METYQPDFDEILIEEVRKYPYIYNPVLEDYKSIRKKDRAWELISKKLNFNATLCRKRWKGLRDCYLRCKRNIAAGVTKQKWRYLRPMSFLDTIPTIRRRTWNNCIVKEMEDRSTDGVLEDECTMPAEEDENALKSLNDYFEGEDDIKLDFISASDYEISNIDSPFMPVQEKVDTFEQQLIEEVRQHKCLYDPSSKDFSNNMEQERVWTEIANNLKSNTDVCKKLWVTLCDMYRRTRERARVRHDGTERKKRWKYYQHMKFLHEYSDKECLTGLTTVSPEGVNNYLDAEEPEEGKVNIDDLEPTSGYPLDPLYHSTSSEGSMKNGLKRKIDSIYQHCAKEQIRKTRHKDSTALLFESLHRNIKEAKLTSNQRLDLESNIASLVYSKLLSYGN